MRTALVLFCCFWCIRPAQAQHIGKPKNIPEHEPYKAALRFNFTGLADPVDNNISLGAELPVRPNWSLIMDLAYIEYSSYFSYARRTSGYMIKPAIRLYPSSLHHNGFFEAVLFYKQVNYHLRDYLGKDCSNGIPAYEQYQDFVYKKRVGGINLQMGLQTALSRNRRVQFEAWIGLGLRVRQQDVTGQENACYNAAAGFGDINGSSGTSVLTSLPAGMRLVYCIQNKP